MHTFVISHLRVFLSVLICPVLSHGQGGNEQDTPSSLTPQFSAQSPSVSVEKGKIPGDKKIPSELMNWVDWATWDVSKVPAFFNDGTHKLSAWSSELKLAVTEEKGDFTLQVTVYEPSWVALPGNENVWPLTVRVNGQEKPVMSQNGVPVVFIEQGAWNIQGLFKWNEMPQTILLPQSIGLLSLVRDQKPVSSPSWDGAGKLWLKRTTKEAADKNYIEVQVYRHMRDGSPMWLYTDVELIVTGKSREEELGAILPEGWKISSLDAQIPCAVDNAGRLKAQVRAGKWVVSIAAFRTTPAQEVQYADGVKPIVTEELISLQNQPNFRLVEFTNLLAVDVAQTTFPQKWRQFPVHLWENNKAFGVSEKMRGMGQTKPPGVSITRSFWLDDDGRELTYKDVINGSSLQTWRLDAADGQRLGAAKIGEDSQLITKNPVNGATGVEVRTRNLNLQSVGRMANAVKMSATGWDCNAESLNGTLYLPPGWRALAIFGADYSSGDWMTNWSLLDVFLLLLITVGCYRLWGWKLGLITFFAFILSYHEVGAPRLVWILLLMTISLFNVLPKGKGKRLAQAGCYASVVIVLLALVPFAIKQIQQAIYPQLEPHSVVGTISFQTESVVSYGAPNASPSQVLEQEEMAIRSGSDLPYRKSVKKGYSKMNMLQDSKAKIQTGPAVPEWSWRSVSFGWSGPVSAGETVSFVLIPSWLQRLITLARVVLLFGLLYGLVRQIGKKVRPLNVLNGNKRQGGVAVAVLLSLCSVFSSDAQAEVPSPEMLELLKQRVLQEPAMNGQLAEIPQVDVTLDGRALSMVVDVHVSKECAVPLPGKLTAWSPISVTSEKGETLAISRQNSFLWVVLKEGIHRLTIKGVVAAGDWEWAFILKPRYVNIQAPSWTFTGVKANGIPESQVFFVEKNRTTSEEAAYDRKDFNPVFMVNRDLELGLEWEVTTTVKRMSPLGKAVSIRLPLLPGERILTPGFNADQGMLEIRLGSQQDMVSWTSQLAQSPEIILEAAQTDQWVEQWQVVTSPVWNIAFQGLSPIYEMQSSEMVPIWKPWPTDKVTLQVARPEGIVGETLTIRQAIHRMNLGLRQRSSSVKLSLQNSLGMDFVLGITEKAEVSSLKLNGKESPVRREGDQIIIPLRPGEQVIELKWKTPRSLSFVSKGDHVKLPVNCANVSTIIELSQNKRWVLWANGPMRGPAVRMWSILVAVIGIGIMLGKIKGSPFESFQWVLLLIGLTQIPYLASFVVVGWLFWVSFKKQSFVQALPRIGYNMNQFLIIAGVVPVIGILLYALQTGLLGAPEMRIIGESSSAGYLKWFQARGDGEMLPMPQVFSVSIWFYRAFMLLWSVWLAFTVIRSAKWAAEHFMNGGLLKRAEKSATISPPKVPPVSPDRVVSESVEDKPLS